MKKRRRVNVREIKEYPQATEGHYPQKLSGKAVIMTLIIENGRT